MAYTTRKKAWPGCMLSNMVRTGPPTEGGGNYLTRERGHGAMLYFDNNASTRPDPDVVDAVARAMADLPGNPSSGHASGRLALEAVEQAREGLASVLGAQPREVVFTSGGTEANNLALFGVARAAEQAPTRSTARRRILVGGTEHPSVLAAAVALGFIGFRVERIPVDGDGQHDLAWLEEAVDDNVLVISVMMANNETGVLSDMSAVVACAKRAGALVHCDATQAVGRVPMSFSGLEVDLMSLSGHKFHGPKGVGALVARRGLRLAPTQHGGSQERSLRAGTLNTPGIVGLGVAARAVPSRVDAASEVSCLRDELVQLLINAVPDARLVAAGARRLPNTANMWFPGADAEAVLAGMPSVAASTGAACAAGSPEPSHVLLAMGMSTRSASQCIRFSLAGDTTPDQVNKVVALTREAVHYVRDATGEVA